MTIDYVQKQFEKMESALGKSSKIDFNSSIENHEADISTRLFHGETHRLNCLFSVGLISVTEFSPFDPENAFLTLFDTNETDEVVRKVIHTANNANMNPNTIGEIIRGVQSFLPDNIKLKYTGDHVNSFTMNGWWIHIEEIKGCPEDAEQSDTDTRYITMLGEHISANHPYEKAVDLTPTESIYRSMAIVLQQEMEDIEKGEYYYDQQS